MATNDDLDDFFKKKDRKGKKQTGLLTNNEELHKQLGKSLFDLISLTKYFFSHCYISNISI
jgi:hypothetical protein